MITNNWQTKKIKEIAGFNELNINDYKYQKIEYIDIASVKEGRIIGKEIIKFEDAPSRAKRILRNNDIIISTVRPNLKHYAFIREAKKNTICSTGFVVITPKKIDPRFLYYYLTQDSFTDFLSQIADAHTSAYPAFNPDIIEDLEILLPEIGEQTNIGKMLYTIDEKIELNNKIKNSLEQISQAIFKHWFIDFEFPNEQSKPYKSSGGEFIDSELGKIPKEWKVISLDKIADFINGLPLQKYRPKGKEFLPVIKIKELKEGINSKSNKADINLDDIFIVKDGDIIFSWSGSLEVKIWCGGIGALNQHLFKVVSSKYPRWLIYLWLLEHLNEFRRIASEKVTTMGHIQRKHLRHAKVIIPSNKNINSFNKIFEPIFNKYILNNIENRSLEEIRDTLLPKLITGKIRVNLDNKKES